LRRTLVLRRPDRSFVKTRVVIVNRKRMFKNYLQRRSWVLGVAIVGVGVLGVGAFAAEGVSPKQAIEARQSNLKDLGGAFKTVRDQLRISSPNIQEIKLAAQQIKDLVGDQDHWFPKGTGPEAGFKTDAKPEIWSDPAGFAKARKELAEQAPKLLTFADANDLAGLRSHVPVVAQSCKGCHDKYRVPKD
jgi:cytochrome c556